MLSGAYVVLAAQAMLEVQFRGDLADVPVLVGRDERDADTFGAGAARAAGPVDVSVTVGRRVEVDHVGDSAYVDPAGGDVGGDERVDFAGLEACERLLALTL